MEIIRLTGDTVLTDPCVATIGFFDGVHRGHRFLIKQVTDEAFMQGQRSAVITFDRHPRQVVKTDYRPELLSTFREKMTLLSTTGIDMCIVLPFDEQMASLSAYDFMEKVLYKRLHVNTLVIGYDNRFGHNRSEGFEDYVGFGKQMGMRVIQAKPFIFKGIHVSSSVVRSFLQNGEIEMANSCLNYEYSFTGRVVTGEHIGRTIGFPTANLQPEDEHKLIPAHGVYAVRAHIGYTGESHPAMMNIGHRPTFEGQQDTLEVNLLHFTGNLYDEQLCVSFVGKLRDEQRFNNGVELARQLRLDAQAAEELLRKTID